MKRLVRFSLLCAAFLSLSCAAFALGDWEYGTPKWITGSGRVETETRAVPGFTGIEVEGSGNVTLSQGVRQQLSVEADDNILPAVTTKVEGGILHLGFAPGTRITGMTRLEFRITAPEIRGITISGSGNVRTATVLRGDSLALRIGGSGSIDGEIDVRSLESDIGGSGSIRVRGRAGSQTVAINGSGSVEARELSSLTSDVQVNGSGNVTVTATETISIGLSGSGDVFYGGTAAVTIRSSGSGTIRKY